MVDKWTTTLYNIRINKELDTHMSIKLSTEHLHYQTIGRSFFQEISCLPEQRLPVEALYPDYRSVGFDLVSERTGVEIPMRLIETKKIDGDIISWTFYPVDKNAPINNVVILND